MTVGTVIGTLVAFLLVLMRSLGQDAWKIAACLMGSYIGGGIFFSKCSPSVNICQLTKDCNDTGYKSPASYISSHLPRIVERTSLTCPPP